MKLHYFLSNLFCYCSIYFFFFRPNMKAVIILSVLVALATPAPNDVKQLYAGQHKFVVSFMNAMHKSGLLENNFVFSPHSVYHALLLAYFGASGETEHSLYDGLYLHWAKSKDEVVKAYEAVDNAHFASNYKYEADWFDKFYVTDKAVLT